MRPYSTLSSCVVKSRKASVKISERSSSRTSRLSTLSAAGAQTGAQTDLQLLAEIITEYVSTSKSLLHDSEAAGRSVTETKVMLSWLVWQKHTLWLLRSCKYKALSLLAVQYKSCCEWSSEACQSSQFKTQAMPCKLTVPTSGSAFIWKAVTVAQE